MAADLEDLGAAAYLGQATKIKRPDVLRLALSIHTVEGAHAAALAGLVGRSITPDGSIAAPADATEVLDAIKPLLKTDKKKDSASPGPSIAGVEVKGMSRGAFLLRGALATAALSGLAAVEPFVAGALGSDELKIKGGPGAKGDIEIANFALTLELLEAEFYKRTLANSRSARAPGNWPS